MQMISEKRPYEKPVLEICGSVSEMTLGLRQGTYLDGGPLSRVRLLPPRP